MTEYGIARNTNNLASKSDIICEGMTKEAAEDWISCHLSGRGSPTEYCIMSREVSDWDLAEDAC
jgi:hypothetical protein